MLSSKYLRINVKNLNLIFFSSLSMILMTVLIVMFMGIALLLAVYSSFLPFVQNYGNTIQYTTAYYGAISAIER